MNCPNCGTPTLAEHEFCRVCGKALTSDKPGRVHPQTLGLVALTFMFGGIMVALTGKMLDLSWLTFLGVFISIGGMFLMALLGLLGQSRTRKRKSIHIAQMETQLRADTTNKLLPIGENDFIPSVTEATTNLLKTPNTEARTK
jgi:hypothetical protein